MSGREVTLVLCNRDSEVLGAVPAFTVQDDWWRDVEEVVARARELLGVEVRILRILHVPPEAELPRGGRVAYAAEVDGVPAGGRLRRWPGDPLAPHPHRLSYAQPGGHQHDLDWATTTLSSRGAALTAAPVQVRTWNLSSIWRLATTAGRVWLKVTPPFCAAEAQVLPRLDPSVVPTVVGTAPRRVLLADVPGRDRYDARGEELRTMARRLIGLQASWAGRVHELEALELPDRRADAALRSISSVVDRNRQELSGDTRRRLDDLVAGLPQRLAALAACGLPDTLVHGDFHPGNVRGTPTSFRILDWGDCGIGNPMLDAPLSVPYLSAEDRLDCIRIWPEEWSRQLPGCDARGALDLVGPLRPLLGAVLYQRFLDNIEDTERPYHEGDPARALRSAAVTTAP